MRQLWKQGHFARDMSNGKRSWKERRSRKRPWSLKFLNKGSGKSYGKTGRGNSHWYTGMKTLDLRQGIPSHYFDIIVFATWSRSTPSGLEMEEAAIRAVQDEEQAVRQRLP